MVLVGLLVMADLSGFSFGGNDKGLVVDQYVPKSSSSRTVADESALRQGLSGGEESTEEIYLPYVQVFFDPLVKSLLTAQVSAPIVLINKRMGASFEPHETLIQLYDEVYKAGVGKAEGLLKRAQIGLTAKVALFEDGVASLFDVADFESAVATAKSDLAAANYLFDCCTLDVPYSGYVAAVLVNDSETPQVGQPLIEVVDTRVLLAKMLFDSTFIDKIFVGQKVKIAVKETNEIVDGTIIRIAPVIDPASAKFKVEAEVPNVSGRIRPGMSGKITLKALSVKSTATPNGGTVR
jgi:membrane fusion protein (multidrug efflux system)